MYCSFPPGCGIIRKIPVQLRRSGSYYSYDVEEHRLVLYLLCCFDAARDNITSHSTTMVCLRHIFLFLAIDMSPSQVSLPVSCFQHTLLPPLGNRTSSDWNYTRHGLDISQMGVVSLPFIRHLYIKCCPLIKLSVEEVLWSVLVLSRSWMVFGHFDCANGGFEERQEREVSADGALGHAWLLWISCCSTKLAICWSPSLSSAFVNLNGPRVATIWSTSGFSFS
jgi:hypothetical protein